MQLSNRIRRLRFDKNEMTQKQLAGLVGVSRQTLNAIENGQHPPKIDLAIRIADVFSVTVDELFSFQYEGKPSAKPAASTWQRPDTATVPPTQSRPGTQMDAPSASFGPADNFNDKDDEPISWASLRKVIGD